MKAATITIFLLLLLSAVVVLAGPSKPHIKYDYWGYVDCSSASMYPTLKCHDRLLMDNVKRYHSIELGAIYQYRHADGFYVIHRVTDCGRTDARGHCTHFYFKGDNNDYYELIRRQDITRKLRGVWYE